MSTFMCKPETIWHVACYLYEFRENHCKENEMYPEDIYSKLVDMNETAVKTRYPDKVDEMIGDLDEYETYIVANKQMIGPLSYRVKIGLALLANLQCFLYQCNEGIVPSYDIYEQLKNAEKALLHEIISRVEVAVGFDRAQHWG